ncbi:MULTISPECIES: hypothetical protein [unclassified Amycolatopsis]|uniref:hypothetical protein n=1 Tax=unclassified Amycolatopsis TaxID=2618356 RepID=UPI002875A5C2|nr:MULTISPECIES: hypothetical protein [unclassified Amycolatopsis]MDS0140626.1 hypothetical protein [Amycolatopsis sp. 505]MDS0149276.1 hypothetical protein [Amycolatopsis sp. CM201R]
MPTQRRRGRLDGEKRDQTTAPINWSPSELAVIAAAASARQQSNTTFIATAALDVATGRFGPVNANGEARGFTADEVTTIRLIMDELMALRRLLANAAGSLNQLAAASNSGNPPTGPAIESALAYLRQRLIQHDELSAQLLDLIEPE